MKSSFHNLIPFLPLFCNCQYQRLLSSIPLLPSSYPGRLASQNWTDCSQLNSFLCNHFSWTTQKTQPLWCWEGMFTALLHSNRSYSIVACIFVAMGMCLPSSCLAMDVSSDFTVPAFGHHVTTLCSCLKNWRFKTKEPWMMHKIWIFLMFF
jgi:hypothetical protein